MSWQHLPASALCGWEGVREGERVYYTFPATQAEVSYSLSSSWLFDNIGMCGGLHPTLTISSSCLYALWDLPGDVLAAPESALSGWKDVTPSLLYKVMRCLAASTTSQAAIRHAKPAHAKGTTSLTDERHEFARLHTCFIAKMPV